MKTKQKAFTLVEILIVVMIIAILAAMSLGAMQAAQDSAAKMRTKATIAKINRFVMEKYASYQYRRVPVASASGRTKAAQETAAANRLLALREIMRQEMPDRWSDVEGKTSAAAKRFLAVQSRNTDGDNNTAELLYMIVTGMPGADTAFSSSEIGDTDGDGLMEFLDGWGRPIHFIRWPGAHLPEYGAADDLQTKDTDSSGGYLNPDPFDIFRTETSFAMFPLIYSAGADGVKNIWHGDGAFSTLKNLSSTAEGLNMGRPGSGTDSGGVNFDDYSGYFDNITNHSMD
ncbi:MAG: type II secretion system protein [Planctomycetia bacterium]|nr:type II secretion system protein [Planctomycetia bacterium]